MNKVTKLFVMTVLSFTAIPHGIFANYQSTSAYPTNSSNRQEQMTADQNHFNRNGEQSNYSTDNHYQNAPQSNAHEHHPVYEYMLGKDGKWHQTTGHADQQQGYSKAQLDSSYNEQGSSNQGNFDRDDQDTNKSGSYSNKTSNQSWDTKEQNKEPLSSSNKLFRPKQVAQR